MEKIDVAELLSNCPSGMELDCSMYDNLHFDKVDDYDKKIHCYIQYKDHRTHIMFGKDGTYNSEKASKCVIFPKGKTTWEGFQRPFKDGDIVSTTYGTWIGIVKKSVNSAYETYITINGESLVDDNPIFCFEKLATEEEKAKLFKVIKDNGYKWNAETKTLEKLLRFKIGDKITNGKTSITISHIDNEYYCEIGRDFATKLPIENQDEWNLVPDKFDITTLVPFESRVLVRGENKDSFWKPAIFGCYIENLNMPYYALGGTCWKYCIPYKGNEHLLGTTDDCDEYFKTWE